MTDAVLNDGAANYTPGVSERRSGTSKFYHGERQGTNALETNASQAVTATRTYDAFGMLVANTGSSPTPFGYVGAQGYQEDGDSGLKLLGHRYYDPSTGRFLTRDHVKDGRNWYGYCENNPTKAIDPSGNFGFLVLLGIIALVVLVIIVIVVATNWYENSVRWFRGLVGSVDQTTTTETRAISVRAREGA